MDETQLLDAVERYLRQEMTQDERELFEDLRRTNPEVDQLVVAHAFFLQEIDKYGQTRELRNTLAEVGNGLQEEGLIQPQRLRPAARVVNMWKRYQRTIAVAACIGGITALCISSLMTALSPKTNDPRIVQLVNKVHTLENVTKATNRQLQNVTATIVPRTEIRNEATGFLIDGRGYLVTNAHVVKDMTSLLVQDDKDNNFRARTVYLDNLLDIAILKIEDSDFKPMGALPYGIKRGSADLAESIYTLGFPREDMVYGEGYMSATTGAGGDTSTFQITVSANPGNSGGPVLNDKGEVIGILSTKQLQTDGAVFAVKSKYIYEAVDSLRKDTTQSETVRRLSPVSEMKSLDRVQQVKKVQDYVFMVKGY